METEDIRIKYAIIHILDSNNAIPVLSDTVLELTNESIREYLKKHIIKCFTSEDNKSCTFTDSENSSFISGIRGIQNESGFVSVSKDFSKQLFELMKDHNHIPSADIVYCIFQIESVMYFGILKMNYKTSFIHFVETVEKGVAATILPQYLALPSESQRVDESVFINCGDFSLLLQEKRVNIHDEKMFYLSELYLRCNVTVSAKSKLNTVTKIADNINKRYYESDIEKKIEFKKALIEEYEEKGEIEPFAVAERVYKNNVEIKNEFAVQIERQGLRDEKIIPAEKTLAKRTERQIFKTDTGIEINIPIDVYDDNRLLEFITNPDGTISIIIKNIAELISK